MIYYRPGDGDVHSTAMKWRPRTCFLMTAIGAPNEKVVRTRRRVSSLFRRAGYRVVDASSVTTGKDFLLKIWLLAAACPIGIAIVHKGISPETMANVYYELGWMQAYGRETVVIKIDDVDLPSDLVRTEYIALNKRFTKGVKDFIHSLDERAEYYLMLADQLESNPLLAIDYLRRSYLLSGDAGLKKRARDIFKASGLDERGLASVERQLASF
jgi:hypothetical protein